MSDDNDDYEQDDLAGHEEADTDGIASHGNIGNRVRSTMQLIEERMELRMLNRMLQDDFSLE
jgi:hypothetical protein